MALMQPKIYSVGYCALLLACQYIARYLQNRMPVVLLKHTTSYPGSFPTPAHQDFDTEAISST